ncbi:NAD(P)H-dependent oxidoreductase [Thalassococcus lentus]|uniref:NAD(P)H-dependent oxidoreductase n=1 Tax=Thalassococcus lentus TaxID=1210524 RepID=A0ABT4XQM4_9RHOB|nr:NAD(P)H-dependent oxidoreductase [Thalassococcus lentus]MDA7424202.1 NAD(P)H-dependent oxidoreductase [Thalassococcus lentus]
MKVLLVTAHPLSASLCMRLADHLCETLEQAGHSVTRRDLYAENYDPCLSADERTAYFDKAFDDSAALSDVQGLVLVFPTWWFGLPAILKGWIDRSFMPGVAYDHAPNGGPMIPRLSGLRSVLAVTTLGAPWWYDRLIARRPVRRSLKWGVVKPCAPKARFRMLSLYQSESVAPEKLNRFESRIEAAAQSLFPNNL